MTARGEGLYCVEQGAGDEPVVLLHGFGGSQSEWDAIVDRLAGRRYTLAFDLPGHARSLDVAPGGAGVAAKSVLTELDRRGVARAHFVGHSFGGAVAAVAALRDEPLVGSLTLLAPGGFGREINRRLLLRFAAASDEAELTVLLEQFFGWNRTMPRHLAADLARERQVQGAPAALMTVAESFFDEGGLQKVIPVAELGKLSVPTKLIWGTQDRVLPTRQAHRLPGRIAVHIFEDVGHMLPYEIPDAVADLILENTR